MRPRGRAGNWPAAGVPNTLAVVGDSMNSRNYNGGAMPWLNALLGGVFDFRANSATNGNTLSGLLGTLDNDYDAASNPGLAGLTLGWVACGIGTADAKGTTGAGIPLDSTHEALYIDIVDKLLTYAEHVVMWPLPPLGQGDQNHSAVFADWNAYIASLPSIYNNGRVWYVDDTANLSVVGGDINTQMYIADDGHHSGAGRYQRALNNLAYWQNLISNQGYDSPVVTDSADKYSATDQWNPNPTNTGTDGTFGSGWSGTAPTGWNISGNGSGTGGTVSIVSADVGDANQTSWVRITPTSSQAGSNIAISLSGAGRTITSTVPAQWDEIYEVRVNALENYTGISSWIQAGAGGSMTLVNTLDWEEWGALTAQGVARQNMHRVNTSASGSSTLYIYIGGTATDTGSMGSIDIRCFTIRG